MARIPLITAREELAPEQRAVYDAIKASRGAVRGPWSVLLHRPPVASAASELGAYVRFRSGLARDVSEAVMAASARMLDCEYEWRSHRKLALEAGVDATTMERIASKRLDGIAGDVGLALEFARALLVEHRVPDDVYERARQRWGTGELVDLASLVGYYSFVATIINTFEVAPA